MRPWVPCEFCGKLGFRYPLAADLPATMEPVAYDSLVRAFEACEEHRSIVELRAERRHAPLRAAYREGRRAVDNPPAND